MKNEKADAERVWKQLEDMVVPRLNLTVTDRVVYSHLLRHSRLEGRPQARFSLAGLSREVRVSRNGTRLAVRRLLKHGALQLIHRSSAGHAVEVRLPDEIRAAMEPRVGRESGVTEDADLEKRDFLESREAREAIHARELGFCFYCLRRLEEAAKTLDHVVPQVEGGDNSYRNLVSCCAECNSYKGEKPAGDFLRWLYRERRLTAVELTDQLRALDALAAGKLRPGARG